MPAPDSGVSKPPEGARAIVETLGLDAGALGDGDLSALTLPHNSDQFTSTELETLANIQAELDRLNSSVEGSLGEVLEVGSEDLESDTIESVVTVVRKDYKNEPPSPEAILPEIMEDATLATDELDMHEIALSAPSPDTVNAIQASASKQLISSCNSATLTSKPTGSSIVVIQSPVASSASLTNPSSGTTHVTVSGGQIFSKIPGIPGSVAISSVPQFQPLNQTLVTAKSADGKNIVQLRPARPVCTSAASSHTTTNLHGIKPLQGSIKRPAALEAGGPTTSRNVFAKVIITGNHQSQQPLLLTSEAGDTFTSAQPIKIISGNASHSNVSILGSPTKAISLSQAQQMGLLSPGKLQQIIPSSPMKQNIIVNKLVTSPVKSPTKITVVPASSLVKPPAKILPAPTNVKSESQAAVDTGVKPVLSPQKVIIRQVKTEPQTSMEMTTGNSTVKPVLSPQKVIIQQGSSLKPGTLLASATGTGQVIRIPATQNVVASSANIAQLQMPASRPLQYVRLVSTPSTISGVGKPHPSVTTLSPNIGKQGLGAAMRTTQQTPIRMVPIAPANSSAIRNIVPKSVGAHQGQRIIIPAATPITQIRAASNVTLSASAVNQIPSGATLLQSSGNSYFMVTTQLVQNEQTQAQQQQSVLNTSNNNTQTSNSSNSSPAEVSTQPKAGNAHTRTTLEPNGIRPRKPCNCTKSQCLKLYCDCFANGEFCHMCNCNNCFNNLEHEEDRQKAIRSCLDRNPQAFRPKIGKGIVGDERRHNKGCNCKRSGCLKNYCECYEAKIPCSNNCKCVGCRNIEDSSDKKSLRDLADAAEVRVQQQTAVKNKLSQQIQDIAFRPVSQAGSGTR